MWLQEMNQPAKIIIDSSDQQSRMITSHTQRLRHCDARQLLTVLIKGGRSRMLRRETERESEIVGGGGLGQFIWIIWIERWLLNGEILGSSMLCNLRCNCVIHNTRFQCYVASWTSRVECLGTRAPIWSSSLYHQACHLEDVYPTQLHPVRWEQWLAPPSPSFGVGFTLM